MASRTFNSTVALSAYLESAVSIAVKNATIRIKDKLYDFVESQYYNDPEFYPKVYDRTYTFLKSCAYEMLSPTQSKIGIDDSRMRYSNGFPGTDVANMAAESMHGSPLYKTSTESYWNEFLVWADDNAEIILKEELLKQGIKTI